MSEINSIANGTFVLGNTSATTYQAGPGISITQPSEGTVRISNDETVLYSGNTNITSGSLNESARNFELLRVSFAEKANGSGYNGGELVGWLDMNEYANGNNQRGTCAGFAFNNLKEAQALGLRVGLFILTSDTTFNSEHYEKQLNTTNAGYQIGNLYVTKVVGINRISGGNA